MVVIVRVCGRVYYTYVYTAVVRMQQAAAAVSTSTLFFVCKYVPVL